MTHGAKIGTALGREVAIGVGNGIASGGQYLANKVTNVVSGLSSRQAD